MTLLGQTLREDGIKEGMERGIEQWEFKTMLELVQEGILIMKEAAARKKMSVEEFQQKIRELKLGL